MGPSVVRFGAEYRGRKAPEETNALASTGLAIYGAIGLVTLPVGLVLAYLAPLLVDAPDDLVWPTRVATALLVAGDRRCASRSASSTTCSSRSSAGT